MKIAVITSFGANCWRSHASVALEGFVQNWPKDVPIYIYADPDCEPIKDQIGKIAQGHNGELIVGRTDEREHWLKDHKVTADAPFPEGKDYRKHYVRFSHKVWAIYDFIHESDADYIIWLDADVVTHKPVTLEYLQKMLPKEGQFVSYMGRKDWDDPETGFIVFRNNDRAKEFVNRWYNLYVTDDLLKEDCWTDAHAFEVTQKHFEPSEMFDLTADISGRDVFDHSIMAETMHHLKGPKRKAALHQAAQAEDPTKAMSGQVLDINNMGIGTVNNLAIQSICDNIKKNLRNVESWLTYCAEINEPVVIASAGPSLNRAELLEWQAKGVKIVAVKHALDRLKAWGIKPWACLLLDGRDHVGGFLEAPDPSILYIVASMVDPNVLKHLHRHRCMVLGYHAYVGSEVMSVVPPGHMLIEGGSATSTRGINVLHAMGFREFHIYGMDCCYFEKPNLAETKDNGKLKFMEITLACESWGNQQVKRTFWTEGQFLAQIQEFKKMYLPRRDIKVHAYGDGAIAWTQKHADLYKQWADMHDSEVAKRIERGSNLEDLIRGIDESRKRII